MDIKIITESTDISSLKMKKLDWDVIMGRVLSKTISGY